MIDTYVQLYVVIGVTYATFRLVMFGVREDELRPATMSPLRYALAAGVAAFLGGLFWPLTFVGQAVRMVWNKMRSS